MDETIPSPVVIEQLPIVKKEGRKCVYGEHAKRITVALDPKIVDWVNSKGNRSRFVNDILRIEKEKEENAKIVNSGIGTKLLP